MHTPHVREAVAAREHKTRSGPFGSDRKKKKIRGSPNFFLIRVVVCARDSRETCAKEKKNKSVVCEKKNQARDMYEE
jgi:hypothetical protein